MIILLKCLAFLILFCFNVLIVNACFLVFKDPIPELDEEEKYKFLFLATLIQLFLGIMYVAILG